MIVNQQRNKDLQSNQRRLHVMETTARRIDVKTMSTVAVMTALCCILGPLSIPIGPVPVSLTVVSAYLCAYVLGSKKGSIAFLLYLLVGFIGVPVFSSFTGGPAKLFGPTGGYLIGFIFMIIITGIAVERFTAKKAYMHVIAMVLGLAVCYLFGTVWFCIQMNYTFGAALAVCVYPFLIFDAIKIIICLIAGNAIRTALKAAHLI